MSSEESETDFHDVDSSFNQTLEPEDIEDEKRLIRSKPVVKRLAEVTKELAGCKLNGSAIVYESDEEVTEGHVVGGPEDGAVKADNMPNNINFDTEDGVDGDKAQEHARSVKVEFAPNNIKFWFMLSFKILMLLNFWQ